MPGGEEAEPLWGALVGEAPGRPWRSCWPCSGRRGDAGLSSTTRWPDSTRRDSALRSGCPDRRGAADDSVRRLAAAFDREGAWWHPEGGAFARPEVDAARVLREVRLGSDGFLGSSGGAGLLGGRLRGGERRPERGVGGAGTRVASGRGRLAGGADRDGGRVVAQVAPRAADVRPARLRRAGESALPDVRAAVRGLRDARSVLLALERMGSRDRRSSRRRRRPPGVRRRRRGRRRRRSRGLQGALCLIDRARFARTLDLAASERLVRSLCDVPVAGPGHARALAELGRGGAPAEAPRAVYGARPPGEPETTLLRAMAGHPVERREVIAPFEWEGLWYQADPGRAEFARLERVRARQGGTSLADTLRACRSATPNKREPCAAALGEALVSLPTPPTSGTPGGRPSPARTPRCATTSARSPGRCPRSSRAPGFRGTCGARSSASSGPSRGSRSTVSPATSCRMRPPCSTRCSDGGSRSLRRSSTPAT